MSWDRIESSWQEAIWERLDLDLRERGLPWPVEAVYGYLRHAERQFRVRGEATPRDPGPRYWTPKGLPAQVVADAKRHLPGRRALRLITGLEERECRRLLASFYDWLDPRSVEEDEKAQRAPEPAGLRLVCPASPESRPPLPESRPPDAPEQQVGPSPASQVPAQDDKFRQICPDRASISARVQQAQEQVQEHDPEEEIRGPRQVEQQPLPVTSPQPTEPQRPSPAPKGQVALLAPPPAAPADPKGKRQPAVPAMREADLQPDEREALIAFRRLLDSMIGQPRCDWVRRPEDEMWLVELHRDVADAIDVAEELKRMQDWLDGHLRRKQAGKSSKFPAMFKPFIRNWLTRQRDEPRHTDRDRDAAYRGVPDGYKPMRMDSNVNYGPRQHHELSEAERAELDRLPF